MLNPTSRLAAPHSHTRRGSALVYLSMALVVVAGLASLAVDVGRVHVVKAEMQLAADAAARYAAAGLAEGGASRARSNALAAAADNRADGVAVALDRNLDVELGTWDPAAKRFAELNGSAESSADTVRVTVRRTAARGNAVPLVIARVVGMAAVDREAIAVARVTRRRPGIVGLDSVSMSGNATNSYRSSSGAFGAGTPLTHRGTVQTNGSIKLTGGAVVDGDAYTGAGQSVSMTGGSSVTGTIGQLSQPLDYPAADAGPASRTNNNANIPGSYLNSRRDLRVASNLTLPGGVYYLNDIDVSGGNYLVFSGPATVYVTGDVSVGGGIITYAFRPANLTINLVGSGRLNVNSSSYLFATVYAPRTDFSMSGGSVLLGSVVAKTVSMTGSAMVIFDEELSASSGVSLVR